MSLNLIDTAFALSLYRRELCTFDFMALMRNLITALGFLKLSSLLTDHLMVRAFPKKEFYEKCKFQKSMDFNQSIFPKSRVD
jgi:hypothetical protein